MTKPRPRARTMPLPAFIAYRAWSYLTWWPWQVRSLRATGCVRVGWMTWELPSREPRPLP